MQGLITRPPSQIKQGLHGKYSIKKLSNLRPPSLPPIKSNESIPGISVVY